MYEPRRSLTRRSSRRRASFCGFLGSGRRLRGDFTVGPPIAECIQQMSLSSVAMFRGDSTGAAPLAHRSQCKPRSFGGAERGDRRPLAPGDRYPAATRMPWVLLSGSWIDLAHGAGESFGSRDDSRLARRLRRMVEARATRAAELAYRDQLVDLGPSFSYLFFGSVRPSFMLRFSLSPAFA